jgi:hypothetical protein
VGGTQERRVGDAGQRTAAIPVFEQSLPEDRLAETFNCQPLSFGGARQVGCGFLEGLQRHIGQVYAQFVDSFERLVQLAQRCECVGDETGAGNSIDSRHIEFGGDAGVGDR